MLQVKHILENKEQVIEGLRKRNLDAETLVQQIIDLDLERKTSIVKVEDLRAEGNKKSIYWNFLASIDMALKGNP